MEREAMKQADSTSGALTPGHTYSPPDDYEPDRTTALAEQAVLTAGR
jgi:hypothetical protein